MASSLLSPWREVPRSERQRGLHREDSLTDHQTQEEKKMTKLWAVLLVLVSLLLAAPVLESGTSESSQVFQAVGNAEGGGGGA
jgi:hypothetical protein